MQTSKTYKLYPGDIKFEDLNGNGYIDRGQNTVDDPGDRKIIGNEEPRIFIVLRSLAIVNNIWVSAFFQGVGKQDWYPSNEASTFWGQYNRPYNQMPSWHVDNYGLQRIRMLSCLVTRVTMRLSMEVIRTPTRAI